MAKLTEYYGHYCESEYEYAFIGTLEKEGWNYLSDRIVKRNQPAGILLNQI